MHVDDLAIEVGHRVAGAPLPRRFRRVRVFGFVNVCDELTDTVLSAPPGSDLSSAFDDTVRMTRWHRNSDYGSALLDFTDRYAPHADALYAALHERWPGVAWAGTVGVGVCASGVEYFDEPGLVLMLLTVPVGRFRVFSGKRPLSNIAPATMLVHADGHTHDLPELLAELGGRDEATPPNR